MKKKEINIWYIILNNVFQGANQDKRMPIYINELEYKYTTALTLVDLKIIEFQTNQPELEKYTSASARVKEM